MPPRTTDMKAQSGRSDSGNYAVLSHRLLSEPERLLSVKLVFHTETYPPRTVLYGELVAKVAPRTTVSDAVVPSPRTDTELARAAVAIIRYAG